MLLEVKGEPAVRINATEVARSKDNVNILLDCEGDAHWFPMSTIKLEPDENTVLVKTWKYNNVFK